MDGAVGAVGHEVDGRVDDGHGDDLRAAVEAERALRGDGECAGGEEGGGQRRLLGGVEEGVGEQRLAVCRLCLPLPLLPSAGGHRHVLRVL